MIFELMGRIKLTKAEYMTNSDFAGVIDNRIDETRKQINIGKSASNLSADKEFVLNSVIEALDDEKQTIIEKSPKNAAEAFKLLKADFDKRKKENAKTVSKNSDMLTNVFNFCESAFGKGSQEMLILVTELTVNEYSVHFITHYGCKEYYDNNKDMMFGERKKEILTEIEDLNLDD